LTRIILKRFEDERISGGHPWIYDNEIAAVEGEPSPGEAVDVESGNRHYLGRGFYNPSSKIRVRLATRSKEGVDVGFWKRRIKEALEYRAAFLDLEKDSFRVLFAEADHCPGLILDLYQGDTAGSSGPTRVAVLQLLSLGVETRREDIRQAIREVLKPDFLVERSEGHARELDGITGDRVEADPGTPEAISINENGLRMRVEPLSGQKTGSYLDQRENHLAAARYAAGRSVADVFCNAGGFGLHALRAGASSVDFLDSSELALKLSAANAQANGFPGNFRTVQANAFDFLKEAEREKRKYGMVVLDPPAFVKTKEAVGGAARGYKDINYRGLKLVEKGGYLVTCSCSFHFSQEMFVSMLIEAARDADRQVRLTEIRAQAKDHPILLGYPESFYLKCLIAQVT
jgi:23S rRNA (cytosine1962-C5)-methyltransferase